MAFYIYSFVRDFGLQLIETGDARFLRGRYVYKKVMIDGENEEKSNRRSHVRSGSGIGLGPGVGSMSHQEGERRL